MAGRGESAAGSHQTATLEPRIPVADPARVQSNRDHSGFDGTVARPATEKRQLRDDRRETTFHPGISPYVAPMSAKF